MRLLNTETLELKQFEAAEIPVYAILSHTWENDEVTLQELREIHTPAVRAKRGYKKILAFCNEVAVTGIEWCWVDTCCIDKTDPVELSQAINSMFIWYRNAEICMAYLSEFYVWTQGDRWNHGDFRRCRWFTRGW